MVREARRHESMGVYAIGSHQRRPLREDTLRIGGLALGHGLAWQCKGSTLDKATVRSSYDLAIQIG
jgi:hypothetical protein